MKKICVLLFATLILKSAIGQITITSTDLPQSGRVNLLAHDTLSQPNIGTASSNAQTWDFTGVNVSYPQVTSYSSTTPYHQYASSFPTANIYTYGPSLLYGALSGVAPLDYTSFGYMYLSSGINGLSVVGYKSDYGITHQTPADKIIETPAQLNDAFNTASFWEVSFNLDPSNIDTIYRSRNTKTVTIDAYGTLTTAFGTFDVLRVHEYFIKTDSAFGSFNGTVIYGLEIMRDTVNNYHFWANGIEYPVAIVKTNNAGHVMVTEVLVDTVASYQITGTVYNTDGSAAVQSGKVQLLPQSQIDNLFGVQEVVDIDNNGHFQFTNVVFPGNFIMIAIPDATQYPDLIPTYYGDSIYWQYALPMQPISDTAVNIYCRNNTVWQNYPGNGNTITGIVWQQGGTNKGPGNSTPARGIRVTLEKNPGGEIIRHDETDDDGVYSFEDLPSFEYVIVVDIPALGMDSTYSFDLTSSNNAMFDGYDYVYDTAKIYIYDATGISTHTLGDIHLNIFPNPFSTNAYVHIGHNSFEAINYEFIIYDLTGRQTASYTGQAYDGFSISSENLSVGLYVYTLRINNHAPVSGKIAVGH